MCIRGISEGSGIIIPFVRKEILPHISCLHIHRYLTLQRSGLVTLDFTEEIDSSYGIDEEGLISEESHVNDPESSLIIPTRDYEHV